MTRGDTASKDDAVEGARVLRAFHTGITVSNLERSLAFYRDVLGFEVVFEWCSHAEYIQELLGAPGVTVDVRHLRVPNSDHQIELVEYKDVERKPVAGRPRDTGQGHVAFFVAGLDTLLGRVRTAGHTIMSEPVTSTREGNAGTRVVYLTDPDGFWIELLERPEDR